MKKFGLMFLIVALLLSATACGRQKAMSEEEAKDACEKTVNCFVGGYLNGSDAEYLVQYADAWSASDLKEDMLVGKIRPKNWFPNHSLSLSNDLCDRIVFYILGKATFEIDPYSFVYTKGSSRAEMKVDITLVRPQAAFDAVYDRFKALALSQPQPENWEEEFYQYAVSVINTLPSEKMTYEVSLVYDDNKWKVDNYHMLPTALYQ